MSGIPTSKIILNELGNKELRERHTYSLKKGENSPFHHIKISNQTPIDQLLLDKKISLDQHQNGIRYIEIIFKAGANLQSPSWEFRDMKNNFTEKRLASCRNFIMECSCQRKNPKRK